MRLVIISDTHGKHEELGILEGDVLIHCGDMFHAFQSPTHSSTKSQQLEALDDWFGRQRFEVVLCTGGNHDFVVEEHANTTRHIFRNAVYLQDERYQHGGLTFYGAPWVPHLVGFAFVLSDEELKHKWEQIPPETDVLITHTPPFHILDKGREEATPLGCARLRSQVESIQPRLHCFGHIHPSFGQTRVGDTLYINAATVSEGYQICNKPVVVDLDPT